MKTEINVNPSTRKMSHVGFASFLVHLWQWTSLDSVWHLVCFPEGKVHRGWGGGGAYVAVATLENLCDNLAFLVFNWNWMKVKVNSFESVYIGKPLQQPGIPCFQLKLDEKESKRNDSKVNLNKMKARALENLCCNLAFIFFGDEMKRENNF